MKNLYLSKQKAHSLAPLERRFDQKAYEETAMRSNGVQIESEKMSVSQTVLKSGQSFQVQNQKFQ